MEVTRGAVAAATISSLCSDSETSAGTEVVEDTGMTGATVEMEINNSLFRILILGCKCEYFGRRSQVLG